MSSLKSRAVRTGGKYLIRHPRSRVTRLVVRLVLVRLARRLRRSRVARGLPTVPGPGVLTLAGVVVGSLGLLALLRKARGGGAAARPAPAPEPATAAPAAAAPVDTPRPAAP